jgi:inner membrane transporter RhtA
MLALAAIGSVQMGSALARTLFSELGAAGVTFLRLAISALILLVTVRPSVRGWPRSTFLAAGLLGTTMSGMNLVFYQSLRTVPLGIAVTVEFLGPLGLALIQTRRWIDALWAALAGLGVALLGLSTTTSGIPLAGLALALLAGILWAGYIVSSARVGRELDGMDGLAVALLVGAVIAMPFGASQAAAVLHQPALLIPATGVALLSSVICYGLELEALRRMSTRVFGVLMSLEPAAAAVAGFVILGQELQARDIAALLLISLASAGITLSRRAGRAMPPPLE